MAQSQIIETVATQRVVLREDIGDGVTRFDAIVAKADYVNQNSRMYPLSVLLPAFEKVNGEVERHPGAVDHPDWGSPDTGDLGIAWEKFYAQGTDIWGTGRIIPTAKGKDLEAVMSAGVLIGFSTRGMGTGEEQLIGGVPVFVLQQFELDGVDAVTRPSVDTARVQNVTKEELSKLEDQLKDALAALEAVRTQLAEAQSARAAAEAALAAAEEAAAGLRTEVAGLKALVAEHTATLAQSALSTKINLLTAEHRFGAAIRSEVEALAQSGIVTLDNVEQIVARVQALVEAAAGASNSGGLPRGNLSTTEDAADKGGLSDKQLAELAGTGLI